MAILVLFAFFCMMAVLSHAHSPIYIPYDNALKSIVDGKSHTHTINTLIYRSLGHSIWGLLGWLTWGIQTILTLLYLELILQFG